MSLLWKKQIYNRKKVKKSLSGNDGRNEVVVPVCGNKGTPQYACLPAVFTLEAAVVLPFLASFFVTLLFFFRVMQVESQVQNALDDTGRTLAVVLASEKEEHAGASGLAAAEYLMLKELRGKKLIERYVKQKAAGIHIMSSKFDGAFVELTASYSMRVCVPLVFPGKKEFRVVQRARCRKWTGYSQQETDKEDDVWVYIAKEGTVYHTTRECSHIRLSIRQTAYQDISRLRNENGEKYHACELCVKNGEKRTMAYITNQGNRYHFGLNCPGLKRTVFMMRLSEVGTRRACSKCGK